MIEWMKKHFEFGDSVVFSSEEFESPFARMERCSKMSLSEANLFVIRNVAGKIRTPFAMSVHEDGFAIKPEMWSPEFCDYDYIGAPWPDGVVGNGGFCIESKRFMDAKATLSNDHLFGDWYENGKKVSLTTPSDVFVCRKRRSELESLGMTWAPEPLAAKFSTEQTHKSEDSFGFHGRVASEEKYRLGWSLVSK